MSQWEGWVNDESTTSTVPYLGLTEQQSVHDQNQRGGDDAQVDVPAVGPRKKKGKKRGYKEKKKPPNRSQHRIPSTHQHPISMGTTQSIATACVG